MIEKIKAHEKKCLDNLEHDNLVNELVAKIRVAIDEIESKLEIIRVNSEKMSDVDTLICNALLNVESALFLT